MATAVLDRFSFACDVPALLAALRVDPQGEDAPTVRGLAAEADQIARPKAIYRLGFVEASADGQVVINDVAFHSRVLRVNLGEAQRVFAYVATCGEELDAWSATKTDIMESFWADGIKLQALRAATAALTEHLAERYRLGKTARMNPGSLEDWPLVQQGPLFRLVGDVSGSIGVRLTDSFLMIPNKSVSGIIFPTEESFESCQLCPRPVCPNRRAPYDAALFERKYQTPPAAG